MYLAGHVRHTSEQGAFRALTRGYTHWASGRSQEMEVNIAHPAYCHMCCMMKPSMKAGLYHVYLLLGWEGELATICSATCERSVGYVHVCVCAYARVWMHSVCTIKCISVPCFSNRESASCPHVSLFFMHLPIQLGLLMLMKFLLLHCRVYGMLQGNLNKVNYHYLRLLFKNMTTPDLLREALNHWKILILDHLSFEEQIAAAFQFVYRRWKDSNFCVMVTAQ